MSTQQTSIPKRAFQGLAGSPLARRTEPIIQANVPRRGRPRKFASNADKMKAYRAHKKKQQAIDSIDSMARGASMTQGHLLVTGGYTAAELGLLDFRQNQRGKRVRPPGHGPNNESKIKESVVRFAANIHFPTNWKLSDFEKDRVIQQVFCELIESPESSTRPEWDAEAGEYPQIPGTHVCALCRSVFDLPSEARAHVMEKHGRYIRRVIRERQPRRTDNPKIEFSNGWETECQYS